MSSSEPIYLNVRKAIIRRIERGAYPAGSLLPSENELAEEFATTRMTVRQAIDDLVAQGLIRRVQGKGSYVANRWIEPNLDKTAGFRELAKASSVQPSVRIINQGLRKAGPFFAQLLHIDEEDEILFIKRVNCIDDEPFTIELTHIPIKILPGIEDIDFSVFSVYESYGLLGHEVSYAQEKLDIVSLPAREAGILNCECGSPALYIECMSFDENDVPLEFVMAYSRGDRGGYRYFH